MQRFTSSGFIVFDPIPETGSIDKLFKPYWAIIATNDDIDDYYRWFIQKRFGLLLQPSAWGPHITFSAGYEPSIPGTWENVKSKYQNSSIEFEYELTPKSDGEYWWLKVYCDEILKIRKELYVPDLKWTLHLTLGTPIPRQKEHSAYIHRIETENI